jgi:hypothetical protein
MSSLLKPRRFRWSSGEAVWTRVAIPADVLTGCWEWTGLKSSKGYGRLPNKHGTCLASRIVWRMLYGPIPQGLVVRHVVCRNPGCVNPVHLALGTHADNMADMVRDGMSTRADKHWARLHPEKRARGTRNGSARLSESSVIRIREAYATGQHSQRALAVEFGVSQRTIGKVTRGLVWTHVAQAGAP